VLSHQTPPRSMIARITAILGTFRTGNAHSVTELSRLTGLPISTTHRVAHELASWNLLYRRPDSTFEIGSALRGLGEGIHSFSGLPQEGAHLLADLSEATGRRARLAILMNRRVFYMEKRPNVDPVTTFSLAATLPAYATAVGKVLLAFTPPRSVAHIVRPMVAFTPHTIDSMERLYRELHVIRSQGFSISSEEHFAGESTVGLPVFGPDGSVAAAAEVELGRADGDLELCRAALMVGTGALSRALAAAQIDRNQRHSRAVDLRIVESTRVVGK
jgi:DNA-binding IclR family transcriptional regulator